MRPASYVSKGACWKGANETDSGFPSPSYNTFERGTSARGFRTVLDPRRRRTS